MTFYRNSDLKKDKYFHQKQFKEQINEAKSNGKDVFYNTVRKINNCYNARKLKGDIYIKDIFILYWELFKIKFKDKLTRIGLVKTIDSFVSCHNFENGYLFYECPNCNNFHMIGFSCHTRFCPSCGKKYRDQRTIKVSEKCIEVPHRQFVFTIPFQLREYFRKYRKLLNILFQSVKKTLNLCLKNKAPNLYIKEKRTLGFISFLHTYGRDMKWHPHIHVLIAERYLNNKGELKKFDYFHFEYLRITFRNILFDNIYNFYKTNVKSSNEIREMYLLLKELKKTYTKGYYVYGRKFNKDKSTTKDIKTLTNYIARYASHPAISERRITNLDTNTNQVTWFYDPHEDDDIEDEEKKIGRQYITEDVFDFMAKLLIHLPDKGFQQIRYYGFYSNKFKDKITNNSLFPIAQLNKMIDNTKWVNNLKSSYGYNPLLCHCGHFMFYLLIFRSTLGGLVMKLKFNTVKIPLSTKEKRDRVRFYNEFENENVDEEEFIKQDIFEEFVDMKCLHCKYEERIEADILFEMFSPRYEDYPSLTCPHCERDSLVPLDIFNQLKNK